MDKFRKSVAIPIVAVHADIISHLIYICLSVVEKSSLCTLNSTSRGTNLCHWKTKLFKQIKRKEWISKFIIGILEINKNAVATAFPKS